MNTARTTKNLAKTIAKQIAQEPLEILKDAREQVTGVEQPQTQNEQTTRPGEISPQEKAQREALDKMKSGRRMEALDRELADISREGLFKELQQKISEGKEVYVDEYSELSVEQKQVLKAQQEAVEKQKEVMQNQSENKSLFGSSKPSRRFGQKQQAQKEQTRVEKPVPPSG